MQIKDDKLMIKIDRILHYFHWNHSTKWFKGGPNGMIFEFLKHKCNHY